MSAPASEAPERGPGRRPLLGPGIFSAGIACEALGFILLARGSVDLAPALLVGSFGVMAWGVWLGW